MIPFLLKYVNVTTTCTGLQPFGVMVNFKVSLFLFFSVPPFFLHKKASVTKCTITSNHNFHTHQHMDLYQKPLNAQLLPRELPPFPLESS